MDRRNLIWFLLSGILGIGFSVTIYVVFLPFIGITIPRLVVPHRQIPVEFDHFVTSLDFSPDGRTLASVCNDNQIVIWTYADKQPAKTIKCEVDLVGELLHSQDGEMLVTWRTNNPICVYSLKTGKPIQTIDDQHVHSVVFGNDGETLISAGSHGLRVWDIATGGMVRKMPLHVRPIKIAYARKRHLLIFGYQDGTIAFQDDDLVKPGAKVEAHAQDVMEICLDKSERHMVTIGWEQSVCFWDLESRKITDLIHAHEDRINAAAITPDGSLLATGGEDKTVILWEMEKKDKKHVLHHSDAVMSLAFTLDGGTLVTGMHHNIITNWDVQTGKQIGTLKIQE